MIVVPTSIDIVLTRMIIVLTCINGVLTSVIIIDIHWKPLNKCFGNILKYIKEIRLMQKIQCGIFAQSKSYKCGPRMRKIVSS